MTVESLAHRDTVQSFLGEEYRAEDPIWNFLRYKFGEHSVEADDGVTYQHLDQYLLRDQLKAVRVEGFKASADTIFSLWTTLSRAIELDSEERTGTADLYRVRSAQIGGVTYTTPEEAEAGKVGGRWRDDAKAVKPADQYLGVRLLLDALEDGRYAEVTSTFVKVARLLHRPGNMLLVPVISGTQGPGGNLNMVRNARDKDYFDRTLKGVKDGRYRSFFPAPTGPHLNVAERFRLDSVGGVPTSEAFAAFVRANHLEMFLDADGSVKELWTGSLTRSGLPQTLGQCLQWSVSAETIIAARDLALSAATCGAQR